MMALCILVSVVYAAMITILLVFSIEPSKNKKKIRHEQKRFSVVVAARNEASTIEACITSLIHQDYPKDCYEVIVVDDHSTDGTLEKMGVMAGIKAVSLVKETGKKAALAEGITRAKFEYIAVTDADCVVGRQWLEALDYTLNLRRADLVTGPVRVAPCDQIISAFEAMDAAIMMKVTAFGSYSQSYFLANGANMAFSKKSYQDLGGYQNHQHYASGDDVFLFAEAARRGLAIAYAAQKEAMVTTRPQTGFQSLMNQRKRWATKTRAYAGRAIWLIQATVAATQLCLLCMVILGLFYPAAWKAALLLIVVKWTVDFVALWNATGWQQNRQAMKFFLHGQVIYLYMILYSAWHALFPGQYEWKGREVK